MEFGAEAAWDIVQAAAHEAERLAGERQPRSFVLAAAAQLHPAADGDPDAVIRWNPASSNSAEARQETDPAGKKPSPGGGRWESLLQADDPRAPILELYLPICSATIARPITVAHLGQSLDGFIATQTGDSRWVT